MAAKEDCQKHLPANNSEFKILLSHDPSHWEEQVKVFGNKVQLTLAVIPMECSSRGSTVLNGALLNIAGTLGRYQIRNGRVLNINRGFGFLVFRRIGICREITVIELKKTA
ncbi:hypothetical protein CS542_09210 [Pedobacter sp. IW39]|nr:hypothetical protein CS542_09210 [Pedobacter sp. IW39]